MGLAVIVELEEGDLLVHRLGLALQRLGGGGLGRVLVGLEAELGGEAGQTQRTQTVTRVCVGSDHSQRARVEVMHAAVKDLQKAGAVWDAALDASENAPPDPGFVDRLRAIAQAAECQTEALDRARVIPVFTWKPVPDTENMILSNELRPGGNRPGPDHLWESFDLTVDRLALAMEGNYASLVYEEYMELAIVLREIVEALEAGKGDDAATDESVS